MTTRIYPLANTRHDDIEQIAYRPVRFQRVSQLPFGMNNVIILAPDPLPLQITGPFQLRDDPLHRALGNPDRQSHFTQRLLRISSQTNQNMSMIRKKIPVGCANLRHRNGRLNYSRMK